MPLHTATSCSPFQRSLQWVLILFFVLVLLVPGMAQLCGVELHSNDFEQRSRASFPGVPESMRDVARFPKKFNRWYSDSFGLRGTMIKAYVLAKYHVLGAIQVNKVVFGRDGWLFLTGSEPEEDPIAAYRGTILYTPGKLEAMAANLNAWDAWCRARGITFVVLVAPNKSFIFPEFLPPGIAPVPRHNRVTQFLDHMRRQSTALIVDPTARLLEHKDEYIYYKTDSHWTGLGAFYAMQVLQEQAAPRLQALQNGVDWRPYTLSEYTVTPVKRVGGDLANMIIMTAEMPDRNMVVDPVYDRNATAVATGAKRPRAVLYGDSFSTFLPPFLAQDFDLVETPQNESMDPAFIESSRPVLLMLELVERNVPKLVERTRKINFAKPFTIP